MFERIAITFPGDLLTASSWSGTPLGVVNGVRDCGIEPVPMNIQFPFRKIRFAAVNVLATRYLHQDRDLAQARQAASLSPLMGDFDSLTASLRLSRAAPLDGLIQIGCSYHGRSNLPFVTYEDMTIVQARRANYPAWESLSDRTIRNRVATQRSIYRRAKACCVMTPWAAQSVVEDYGINPAKVHVVGVGNNHPVVGAINRDWSQPRFLFVGNDWQRKNGGAVVRAFGALRREFPTARLDLVGAHPALAHDGIVGHGALSMSKADERDLLTRLFASATCFVMPSLVEPAGIVFVEAAAAGIPSICSSAGGSSYLVGDGGLAVSAEDDADLLNAMRDLCNPRLAAAMGARARDRSELFTWKLVAERLLEALNGKQSELDELS